MFKELSDKINYSQLEREILKFWEDNQIFEKSVMSSFRTAKSLAAYQLFMGPII